MNAQEILKIGGKKWEKGGMERIYINAEAFNKLAGTNYNDSNNKFFYDCCTGKVMRSYKGKKPKVEL